MKRSLSFRLLPFLQGTAHNRGLIFGMIILCALLAFEVFNFSSTLFALTDILGNLAFGPVRWATTPRWSVTPSVVADGLAWTRHVRELRVMVAPLMRGAHPGCLLTVQAFAIAGQQGAKKWWRRSPPTRPRLSRSSQPGV